MNTPFWFYSDTIQTYGPVTRDQLIGMIQAGQIVTGHFIMVQGGEEWQPVSSSPFAAYMPQLAMPGANLAAQAVAAPDPFRIGTNVPAAPAAAPAAAASVPAQAAPPSPPAKPAAPPLRPVGQPYRAPQQPVPKPQPRGKNFWATALGCGVVIVALVIWMLRPSIPPQRKTVERIEGEAMKILKVTGGEVDPQLMSGYHSATWSRGSQLFWKGGSKGYILQLQFNVAEREAGKQRLKAVLTGAADYAVVGVMLDGRRVKGSPFDMQAEEVIISDILDWGLFDLKAGAHVLEFTLVTTHGKDVAEIGEFCFGLDYIQLEPPTQPAVLAAVRGTDVALTARPSASACPRQDDVNAMNSGKLYSNSKSFDADRPRQSWWPRLGGLEWAQYEWETSQAIDECQVLWYADQNAGGTERGGCALPVFWRILYRDETGAWWPVETTSIPTAPERDKWNVVKFNAVKTTALRLSMQSQPDQSVGIYGWKAFAADPETVLDPKTRATPDLFLGDLTPLHAQVNWATYRVNTLFGGDRLDQCSLVVGGRPCTQFLWAHPMSRIEFAIPSGYTRFTAYGILPLNSRDNLAGHGRWKYKVEVDGKTLLDSKELASYPAKEMPVDVSFPVGSKRLTLITTDAGDANGDHAYWAYPALLTASSQKNPASPTETDKWPKLGASTSAPIAPSSSLAPSRSTASPPVVPVREIEIRPSRDGGDPSEMHFINKLAEDVKIQWVEENGRLTDRGNLKAGRTNRQRTYIGHVWLITAQNGSRLGLVESKEDRSTVIIDTQGVHVQEEEPPSRQSQQLVFMIQFTGTNIGDAVAFLRQRVAAAGLNVQIELDPRVDPKAGSINLDAREGPLEQILGTSALQAGLRTEQRGSTYHIVPR